MAIKTYVKKSGEISVYDYSVGGGLKPFKKNGELRKPFLNRIKKQLNVEELTKAEEFDIRITAQRLYKHYTQGGKELSGFLTPARVVASYRDNKLEGMLLNTGFSLEQLAQMTNTTVEVLTNSANWKFTKINLFTNDKGETYEFTFDYNSDVVFHKIG